MSDVSQTLPAEERKERRRLHLREVAAQPTQMPEPESDDAPEVPPVVSGAAGVGAALRAARIARGEDAATIAGLLKMRRDQLDAVEEGDLTRLPGRTYAIGFVRAYAKRMGLDADALVQQFKDETAGQDVAKPADLVFPEARDEYRRPGGSIVAVALAIALVIYGITYLTMPSRKAATMAKADETQTAVVVDPAPKPLPPKPVQAPPPESNQAAVEVAVDFIAGAQTLPEQKLPQAAGLEPVDSPVSTGTTQPATMPATAPATSEVQVAGAAQTNARIVFKFSEPTYIQIRDTQLPRSRAILVARVFNVGESFAVPNRAGLTMQTGNAGGVQVEVDSRSLGVFGRSGEVITRVPLDPSYFIERMAASQ